MKLETIIKGTPVTLPELLDAREQRVFRQRELLEHGRNDQRQKPYSLISFTMNVAGEIKAFPLCHAAFDEGLKELRARIPADLLMHFEDSRTNSGPEAFFLLSMSPENAKKLTTAIEESHPLGRLFDMDVLGPDGKSISRSVIGLPMRTCLICGENAKVCARSRRHTLEVILWRTAQILNDYFKGKAADAAAACAVRALLYEVSATPKPGLVDRNNSGSHSDMDFFTFLDSSAALIPWFRDFFCIGWDHCEEPDAQLFSRLRFAGQESERSMFTATRNINTHKGLIFAAAIILGALGKAYAMQNSLNTTVPVSYGHAVNRGVPCEMVLSLCQSIAGYSLDDLKRRQTCSIPKEVPSELPASMSDVSMTFGEQIYDHYGLTGARGEAAAGFPSAIYCGLPALKHWLNRGLSLNDSSALALLTMLSKVDDTNMIHRGGRDLAKQSQTEAGILLEKITPETFQEIMTSLDKHYMKNNLSPGGCADLLAISLLFLFLENSGMCN